MKCQLDKFIIEGNKTYLNCAYMSPMLESVENAGKLLSKIVFASDFNKNKHLHLSNKLIFYKKHKLLESEVSEEANKPELALKLWNLSQELCRSFGFVSFNI